MKNVLLFIVVLCAFGCKTNIEKTNTKTPKTEHTKMETTEPKVIAKGNLYGSGEEGIIKQNLIVTNQADWDTLIAQLDSVNKVSAGFTVTTIDFSKEIVIAVFDEVKGSGGHRLELAISQNSDNTLVEVTRIAPKGMATSVMTQPYYIVKIANNTLPIVFK